MKFPSVEMRSIAMLAASVLQREHARADLQPARITFGGSTSPPANVFVR